MRIRLVGGVHLAVRQQAAQAFQAVLLQTHPPPRPILPILTGTTTGNALDLNLFKYYLVFHFQSRSERGGFAMLKMKRKTGLKIEMAVRRALGYIQVGGRADVAADAAPSPARYARGRRSQAHAPTGKPKTGQKARRRRGIAAEPLGDCRAHLSPRTAFFPSVLYRYCFPLQGTPRFRYVTFGNRAITSLSLDCPMYSPSIQHPKSSKSMNFLPSSP